MTDPRTVVPSTLADALAREIDPGEAVLWSGVPSPRRYAAKVMPLAIAAAFWGVIFFGMMAAGSLSWVQELQPVDSSPHRGAQLLAWLSLIVTSLLLLAVLLSPFITWRVMISRARNTVYALTPTRVLELRVARGGVGGVARIKSVEPSHPMEVARRDFASGTGDVILYPTPRDPDGGKIVLVGIASPREVERMLREAFNPK